MTDKTHWTDAEVQFIKDNSDKTNYWLAKQLGRSNGGVKTKRTKLGEHRNFFCIECGTPIQKSGKYCGKHTKLGNRIRYYASRITVKKGGNISKAEIRDLLLSPCEYCNKKEAMGIDRVDSSLGYLDVNSVPCCSKCNVMKMGANVDEWYMHMEKILKHKGKI